MSLEKTHPIPQTKGPDSLWPLLILLLATTVWLFQSHASLLQDPDIYWHIFAGDWILSHGDVPRTDPFSYTMAGTPWLTHEWLAEVLFSIIFSIAGWHGLIFFSALCAAATLAWLTQFLLERAPIVPSLLLVFLAWGALLPHLVTRPHLIAWFLLVVWAGTLVRTAEHAESPPWWLLPLMVLWANIHGSFILGLILIPLFGVEAVIGAPLEARRRRLLQWAGFLGLALPSTLLSPLGWKGLFFLSALVNIPKLGRVAEWSPADFSSHNPLEPWLILLLSLACLGLLRLSLLRLFLLMALLHMALAHSRYIPIFGLLTPILIVKPFGDAYRSRLCARPTGPVFAPVPRLIRPSSRASRLAVCMGLGLIAVIAFQTTDPAPAAGITPKVAIDQAIARGLTRGRVFNHYNFGGYLISRGIPVFIDGRIDLYGGTHLDSYLAIQDATSAAALSQALNKTGATWTLLPTDSATVGFMDQLKEWERIYADEVAVIHSRHTTAEP